MEYDFYRRFLKYWSRLGATCTPVGGEQRRDAIWTSRSVSSFNFANLVYSHLLRRGGALGAIDAQPF